MSHPARPPLHIELELVRAAEAASPHGVAAGEWNRYLLRNPDGSGCYEDGQFLWNQAVQADLAATSDAAAAGEAVARLAAAMRRFIDTAGWARIAADIRDARAGGRAVCLTVRSPAHEIYTLPWELLDLDGTPLCETEDCLLRYECPDPTRETPPQAPSGPSGRVLVAWSGGVPAAEHIDAVAAAARAGNVRFERSRDVLAHASLAGLDSALREHPVTILHLLCHGRVLAQGRAHGLALDGATEPVPPTALRELLAPHRHSLRLVVLSACLGSSAGAVDNAFGSVAQAVLDAGIPAVIAARYPLSVAGSVLLAQHLYQRLFVDLWSLERAFVAARSALRDQANEGSRLDVVALQLHVQTTRALDFRPWIIRPYRGLNVYDREDARLFFGRDEERQLLLRRMAGMLARDEPRFLLVAGASGTGKSSLVRAGLLDALEKGRLSGNAPAGGAPAGDASGTDVRQPWATAVLRPGEGRAPVDRLTRCLEQHRAAPGARLALVVDQLEELFTEISDQGQREDFLRALWRLACERDASVFVIATLRSDYLGHLGTVRVDDAGSTFDRELLEGERYYLVRQLGPEQYEHIIRGPAEAAGGLIEPGLLDRLLEALRAEPGALPLLSYTLDQLWQQRSFASQEIDWSYVTGQREPGVAGEKAIVTGWWLTDAAYSALGGIGGALARSADALHAALDPAHQAELRRVLVQLVHDHDDPMLATRRRGWRQALQPGAGSARIYDQVVDALVDARLLVQGSAGGAEDPVWIELAHDALIRFWPRLRQWHQEARAWLAHADELREMAEAWQPHARSDDAAGARAREEPYLILRGQRLSYHLEAWGRYHEQLGVEEQRLGRAFLDACARAESERIEAERAREHAARRRTRVAALAAVVVAVVMSALGLWARGQQREAEAQRVIADEQRAAAERQGAEAQAQRVRAETSLVAARDALLMTGARELVARNQPAWATRLLEKVSQPVDVQAWRSLALEALSQAWLVSTLRGHEDAILDVAFSADGQRVATASYDGTARVWRADGTGEPLVLRHEGLVHTVDFSPDGQRVVTASHDGPVRLWPLDAPGEPLVLRHEGKVHAVDFSPDGELVVTAGDDHTARIWRVDDGVEVAVLRGHAHAVLSAVFSPDGELVATGSADGTVRMWRLRDLGQPAVVRGQGALVFWVAFSPDGKRVAAGGSDGTPWLWPVDDPSAIAALAGHGAAVMSASFYPDGQWLLTASLDKTVRRWSVERPDRSDKLEQHDAGARVAAFSPDGWHYVTAFEDGTVHLWHITNEEPVRADLVGHEGLVFAAAFSPDSKRLVTASEDGTARIWHAAGPDRFFTTLDVKHAVLSAAFSADGRLVLTTSRDRVAQVWRSDGGGRVAILGGTELPGETDRASERATERATERAVDVADLSPDGEHVATAARDGILRLWRVDGAGQIATVQAHQKEIHTARFSADGKLLVTASSDRTARIWRAGDLTLVATSPDHEERVSSAIFSPDGKLVVTITWNGAARIWSVADPAQVTILGGRQAGIIAAAFSADGKRLITTSHRETCVWSIDDPAQPTILRQYPRSHIDAALSPDGTQVITTRKDLATVRRVHDPAQAIVLRGHLDEISTAAFSPDGKLVLTTSIDGEARIWSLDAPDQPAVLSGLPWLHNAAAFSPDGKRVLTVRPDGTVRISAIDVEGLKASLRRASTDCLTAEMRQRYMGEAEAEARRGYEGCERGYGRVPLQPRTSRPGTSP
jgi:WD40 repeat protein